MVDSTAIFACGAKSRGASANTHCAAPREWERTTSRCGGRAGHARAGLLREHGFHDARRPSDQDVFVFFDCERDCVNGLVLDVCERPVCVMRSDETAHCDAPYKLARTAIRRCGEICAELSAARPFCEIEVCP